MKKVLIYLTIIYMICLVAGCGFKKKEKVLIQDVVSNSNEQVYQEEENNNIGYKITSFAISEKKYSTIVIEVTNKSDKEFNIKPFQVDFIGKNEKVIYSTIVDNSDKIKSRENILISIYAEKNLQDIVKVKYIFNN